MAVQKWTELSSPAIGSIFKVLSHTLALAVMTFRNARRNEVFETSVSTGKDIIEKIYFASKNVSHCGSYILSL